jgi:hypothetical protein
MEAHCKTGGGGNFILPALLGGQVKAVGDPHALSERIRTRHLQHFHELPSHEFFHTNVFTRIPSHEGLAHLHHSETQSPRVLLTLLTQGYTLKAVGRVSPEEAPVVKYCWTYTC